LPQLSGDGPVQHRCCSIDDVYDARRVAQHLDFPHYVVNFEDAFEQNVIRPFVDEYLSGRTPIPCTLCNNHVKFDPLLRTARQIGAARLATGHYARVRWKPETRRHELWRARDDTKDQSYFLFGLTQEQLAHTVFPLGELTKEEVRAIARRTALPVAEKPESQELCFVPSGDYVRFIGAYLAERGATPPSSGGEIVSTDGELLGHHHGLHHFTVGQRRGLGLAAGRPLYVVALDPKENRVIVGQEGEQYRGTCDVRDVNWIAVERLTGSMRVEVKIRHKHSPATATIEPTGETAAHLHFDVPQRAVSPGQAAVFYTGDCVLGGGWISD
jgi:tRNA-specific 2-thiouridylase